MHCHKSFSVQGKKFSSAASLPSARIKKRLIIKLKDRYFLHYCSLYLLTTDRNVASVFIDAEQTHPVELGQLGKKDAQEGACVDQEVGGIVFGVKAGQDVPKRGQNKWKMLTCQLKEETLRCRVIE